mgnify:CR=1 FL=1
MIHWSTIIIFAIFFILVTVIGLYAGRWRKADLGTLDEWGLGGRTFGTIITWLLVGGDLYTAYTLVAVPALVYGKGGIGFFALPYTIIVYPMVFLVMPKLWQVAKRRGLVTPSDYVRERFDSRLLALLVAITGIIATIPYIALQMYGLEVVLGLMGIPARAALIGAFIILAAFSYISGLRAPALIALVKDILIYTTFIIAVIYIPVKLGGFGHIFAQIPNSKESIPPEQYAAFSTLALGSAMALFLYPHAITGVFGSNSAKTVRRNMSILPAYTFLLGLIALLGYIAIAAGIKASGAYGANGIVPRLLLDSFPGWFAGYAFAAIGIGALVPASVMSIAAANLFSRNIYKEFFRPHTPSGEEATVSKVVTLLVMLASLAFIIGAPTKFVINFQLAGGVWILQTLPAVFLAIFIKWLHRWAIVAGWVVGIGWGTYQLIQEGFASSLHPIGFLGSTPVYIALSAWVANMVVVFLGTGLAYLLGSRPTSPIDDSEYEDEPAAAQS